ncbi:PEGA domain-containing protein [uncultured Halovibrio sp.]|uniref:PEGA domain-containing protein n=1 Tax=uncultured Halovibrio sp. TaxID=985049 RepID=UPI0025D6F170|nr:PEGA domain-containing protein [uncultured Halovibrio sp.]
MLRVFAIGPLLTLIFLINGCATVVSGTDQTLTFDSEPEGATVTVSGRVLGKTPVSTTIDKSQNQALTFQKEGYKEHTTQLSTSVDGWFWGNIFVGGLYGSTTDGVSGAMYEYAPDQYFVTLTPEKASGVSTSKKRKLKELVVAFGDDIRMELASDGGEKLDALLDILETPRDEEETTIAAIDSLAANNKNNLNFAKAIIDLYEVGG